MGGKRIPDGNVCYICGKKAERRERNANGIDTGKLICKQHYNLIWVYGSYEKPKTQQNIYRINVSYDGINFFSIVYIDRRLIMNPTGDDLKGTKLLKYNDTNICNKCREDNEKDGRGLTEKSILYPGNARNFNIDGKSVWYCEIHSSRYRSKLPDSSSNIRKLLTDHRTGNVKDPTKILGDNCEELTEKWTGAKRLSVKYDKYSQLPLDHGPITEHISVMVRDKLVELYGKVPQTKGSNYHKKYGSWEFGCLDTEWNKEFDIEILWCISEDGMSIERGYIIPKKVIRQKTISIVKNPSKGVQWYEEYRVIDEETLKKINIIWKKIIIDEIKYLKEVN